MHRQQLKKKASRPISSRIPDCTSTRSTCYLKTRIRGSRLLNAARILLLVELTRRLHQAYAQAYDKQASDRLLPQNTGALGKAWNALLEPPCIDFYTRVLNSPNVNTKSNPVLEGGDLFKIFQDFLSQKQGGLTRKPFGAGFGSAKGVIRPGKSNSDGTIYLPVGPTDWHEAVGLVGEIFHLAGRKGNYYDYELAVAVNNIPEFAAKFSQVPERNIFDQRWQGPSPKDKYNGGYSTYFHDIERHYCTIAK